MRAPEQPALGEKGPRLLYTQNEQRKDSPVRHILLVQAKHRPGPLPPPVAPQRLAMEDMNEINKRGPSDRLVNHHIGRVSGLVRRSPRRGEVVPEAGGDVGPGK